MTISKTEIMSMIENELNHATTKFPTWPIRPEAAALIVAEEAGELMQAVNERVNEPHKGTTNYQILTEAIQTAVTAIRFANSIHEYDYGKPLQLTQDLCEVKE